MGRFAGMRRMMRLPGSATTVDAEVDDELRFHLETRVEELVRSGLPRDAARLQALREFGDLSAARNELGALGRRRAERVRRGDWWRGLSMDLAFAGRTLRKNAGFTAAAVFTLALGIGATAAVFTVVNGVLLQPLPYADAGRVVMVWMTGNDTRGADNRLPLSPPNYLDVQSESRSFASLGAFRSWPYTLGDASVPERLASVRAAPAMFRALGVQPLLGRTFTDDEAVRGGPAVVVISHALWQRRFGADPAILGRPITLSGQRYTVLGVMPAGFAFPRGTELPSGFDFPARTDLWTPLVFDDNDLKARGTLNLAAVGRLRPGVSPDQANADLAGIATRLVAKYFPNTPLGLSAVTVKEQAAAPVRRGLLILMGAVVFVLLIACANVANLLVARTGARRRELAVRAALGAGAGRIARQLVTENVVLALAGATLGIVVAVWGSRFMLSLVPGTLPRADDVGVDRTVLFAAGVIAAIAGTAFGLATAVYARRSSVAQMLHDAGTRTTGGGARSRGRRVLVTAEIALSLVLLVGAGLLTVSFMRLQRIDPGFVPDHALTAQVSLPIGDHFDPVRDGPSWARFFSQLSDRIAATPGVSAAGAVSSLPLSGAVESAGFNIEGAPPPAKGNGPSAEYAIVSGDYFRAMGIKLVSGRVFDTRDTRGAVPVIVVSRETARRYFPGGTVVGKRMTGGFDFTPTTRQIIGVVDDVRQTSLDAEAAPGVYVAETQMSYPGLTLVVRTSGDPLNALAAIQTAAKSLDPTLAVDRVRPLNAVFADSLARQRFSLVVLAVFAAAALALALVGLYGVIALSVGQRKREIGVRLALGAQSRDVLRLVLGEGARVAAVGIVVGLAGAFALTRVMQSLLFGVSASDASVYAGAALVVAGVALLATYLPARRATLVDPTVALRAE